MTIKEKKKYQMNFISKQKILIQNFYENIKDKKSILMTIN